MPLNANEFLRSLFNAAVASAQPNIAVPAFLPEPPVGRTIVIGAGKASAAMAQALEQSWKGPISGVVVTRYGYAVDCKHIEILQAAHPVPDEAGEVAAKRIMEAVSNCTVDDLVICLISGGGSSLLPMPLTGISLEEKQQISRSLLKSGASISEMNCVRRHLSGIKGGRLAAACSPAQLVNLLISDVPGDDPADIASGPTVADVTTREAAIAIIRRCEIELPTHIQDLLESEVSESLKPDDAALGNIDTRMIAAPGIALQAAARAASDAGITALILGDSIEGEAREVGKVMAGITLEVATNKTLAKPPCVLLSGGETTVTVRGNGRGGRNVEYLLSLAIALKGQPHVYAMAGDTDGVDGRTNPHQRQ